MDTVQHHLFFLGQFGHHLVAVLHEALLFLVQILLDRLGLRAGYQPFLYLVLIVAHVVLETAALGSQLRIGLFGLLLVGGPQVDVHVVSADERVDVEIGYVSARCDGRLAAVGSGYGPACRRGAVFVVAGSQKKCG